MTPNPYFSVPRLKTTPLKATIRFEDIRDPRISRYNLFSSLEHSGRSKCSKLLLIAYFVYEPFLPPDSK